MKIFILFAALFITASSIAQKRDTGFQRVDLDKLQKHIDSSTKMMDTLFDQQFKRMQEEQMQQSMEQNNRNLDEFMRMQKEREAKAKKASLIRIGIGILFLGVLIFGWMRKRTSPFAEPGRRKRFCPSKINGKARRA